jgi:uncharacterized protein (TIGR03067 family)
MRRLSLLLAVLFVLPLLGSDSPKEYDDSVRFDGGLEGEWKKVEVFYQGQNLGASGQPSLVIHKQRFTWSGSTPATTGTFTVDPGKRPARTDQTPLNGPGTGSTWKMIYQVEGDKLLIAYTFTMTEYPKGFDDRDSFVTVMKRVRK